MKTCSRCKLVKPFQDFNNKGEGKKQSHCKVCQKEWYQNYYQNDPKEKVRLKVSNKKAKNDLRDLVRSAKARPCTDCGVEYPYYMMDFDHLNDKSYNISKMVGQARSKLAIIAEIAKCEVVCSNCHRARTHSRLTQAEEADTI